MAAEPPEVPERYRVELAGRRSPATPGEDRGGVGEDHSAHEESAPPTRRAAPRALSVDLFSTLERILLAAYLVIVVALCLYVPWELQVRGIRRPLGYAWLWEPPDRVSVAVDLARVVLALIAATAALLAGLIAARFGRRS